MDCVFCKIYKKEIPAEIIYENNDALAFLDVHPMAPGHTIVIPKIHAANLIELPEEKIAPVFLAVKKVAEKLQAALSPDGFSYGINQGEVTGQSVDHLHIHVVPRFQNDGGKSFHAIVQNPPQEDIKVIAEKIRNAK